MQPHSWAEKQSWYKSCTWPAFFTHTSGAAGSKRKTFERVVQRLIGAVSVQPMACEDRSSTAETRRANKHRTCASVSDNLSSHNQRVQHQSYVLYVLFIFLVVLYGDVCLPKPLRVMGNCLHIDSPSRTRDGITSHKRETDFLRRRQFLRTWSGCRPSGSWIRCTRAR